MLFLKKHSIGGNYGLVTAYEISDTQVVALDRVGQFMVYDKWDKDRFLNIVRDEAGVRRIQE